MTSDSFTFRHEFDGVSELNAIGMCSKIHFHADLPWYIFIRKHIVKDEICLGVYLDCNNEDERDIWRVDHNSSLKFINQESAERSITVGLVKHYSSAETAWGKNNIMSWEILIDSEEGFIKEDKIIVEASVTVKAVFGIRKPLKFDFSSPPSFGSDNAILVVEGKKIHVGKQILSVHSPVFQSMFYGEFVEKDKEEIKLKDVNYEEFIELLRVIYPSSKSINKRSSNERDKTFPGNHFRKAHLGIESEMFHYALERVEKYVARTKKLNIIQKLVVADEFNLEMLMIHCLKSFEDVKEIKALETLPAFQVFSHVTKSAFCTRLLELIEM